MLDVLKLEGVCYLYKMVVAVRVSPPVKGKVPKLNMLELVSVVNNTYRVSKVTNNG